MGIAKFSLRIEEPWLFSTHKEEQPQQEEEEEEEEEGRTSRQVLLTLRVSLPRLRPRERWGQAQSRR